LLIGGWHRRFPIPSLDRLASLGHLQRVALAGPFPPVVVHQLRQQETLVKVPNAACLSREARANDQDAGNKITSSVPGEVRSRRKAGCGSFCKKASSGPSEDLSLTTQHWVRSPVLLPVATAELPLVVTAPPVAHVGDGPKMEADLTRGLRISRATRRLVVASATSRILDLQLHPRVS